MLVYFHYKKEVYLLINLFKVLKTLIISLSFKSDSNRRPFHYE